jgi:ketosteroid isomerase-like protein
LHAFVAVVGVVVFDLLIIYFSLQQEVLQSASGEVVFGTAELSFEKAQDGSLAAHPAQLMLQVGEASSLTHDGQIHFRQQMLEALFPLF